MALFIFLYNLYWPFLGSKRIWAGGRDNIRANSS
jgi:hypothetical protein